MANKNYTTNPTPYHELTKKFMKVLYESLLSDLTKLCDQYETVLSSTLDKRAPLRIAENNF